MKKLITYSETVKMSKEDWDRLTGVCSNVLCKHGLPGIQIEHRSDRWLSNYMEFVNGVSDDK